MCCPWTYYYSSVENVESLINLPWTEPNKPHHHSLSFCANLIVIHECMENVLITILFIVRSVPSVAPGSNLIVEASETCYNLQIYVSHILGQYQHSFDNLFLRFTIGHC